MTEGAANDAANRRVDGLVHELRIALGLKAVADQAEERTTQELVQHCRSLTSRVDELQRAIVGYLDAPGCNINSRATAMAKLRFFAEKGLTA